VTLGCFKQLRNEFRVHKPFFNEAHKPITSPCQIIVEEAHKRDSGADPTKTQQMSETEELTFTAEHMSGDDEILYLFYVNEEKLNRCPRINISIGNQSIPAVIDTGSQVSLMTEELYYRLKSEGVKSLELGVQNAVLVSAIGSKTKRIRTQAMLPLCIDGIVLDHIFLISPLLLTQALLGVDFCRLNNIVIDFPKQCCNGEGW
jgi:hypothetical protein